MMWIPSCRYSWFFYQRQLVSRWCPEKFLARIERVLAQRSVSICCELVKLWSCYFLERTRLGKYFEYPCYGGLAPRKFLLRFEFQKKNVKKWIFRNFSQFLIEIPLVKIAKNCEKIHFFTFFWKFKSLWKFFCALNPRNMTIQNIAHA